jgi:hypothetical protein
MSSPLEAIFQRRAVKVFEPVEIPQAQRELILEAAHLAPSSFNMQPYRFLLGRIAIDEKARSTTLQWARARQNGVGPGRGSRRHWVMAIDHAKPFGTGAPTGDEEYIPGL